MRIFLIVLGVLAGSAALIVYLRFQDDLAHPPPSVSGTIVAINGAAQDDATIEYQDAQNSKVQVYLILPDPAQYQVGQTVKVYLQTDSSYAKLEPLVPEYGWVIGFLAAMGGITLLAGIIFSLGNVTAVMSAFCGIAVVAVLGIGTVVVGNDARLQFTGTTVMGQVTDDYIATVASSDLRSSRPVGQRTKQERHLVVQYSSADGSSAGLLLRAPLTNAKVGDQVPLVVDFAAKPPQAVLKGWTNVLFGSLLCVILLAAIVGAWFLVFWLLKKFK